MATTLIDRPVGESVNSLPEVVGRRMSKCPTYVGNSSREFYRLVSH